MTILMTFFLKASVELNVEVYPQSVAIPRRATLLLVGQPFTEPIVDSRSTLEPSFPVPVSIDWRPKRDLVFAAPNVSKSWSS